ncbi:MAG: hypothetical protein AVDCRST_MAG71-2216, partial [uncultured Lysobacter sp.]
ASIDRSVASPDSLRRRGPIAFRRARAAVDDGAGSAGVAARGRRTPAFHRRTQRFALPGRCAVHPCRRGDRGVRAAGRVASTGNAGAVDGKPAGRRVCRRLANEDAVARQGCATGREGRVAAQAL